MGIRRDPLRVMVALILLTILVGNPFLQVPVAHAHKAVAEVIVGNTPGGLAYDSARGEIWVPNEYSNTVSVISDRNDSVVATIAAGISPSAAAYDPAKGEVFVSNYRSGSVYVFNDTSHELISILTTGTNPLGLAYDAAKGEIFVANQGNGTVSVISDISNSVTATVQVGSTPGFVAYDPGKGEVFVTNGNSNQVSAISDQSNMQVAVINVGSAPTGIVYDSAKGELFVANQDSNDNSTVSVISDKTNSVIAEVGVGSRPFGIAYSPDLGEVFVTNAGSGTVSAISDRTNSVVSSAVVGFFPDSAVYDSAKNEVFVSNGASNSVSVILWGFRFVLHSNFPLSNLLNFEGTNLTADASGNVQTIVNESGTYVLRINSPIVYSPGIRFVFVQWGDAITTASRQLAINGDVSISVVMKEQYFLNATTSYGSLSGLGWYDKGTNATLTLNETSVAINPLVPKVFTGWKGDASGSSKSLVLTMDRPKTVVATWGDDYTRLLVVVGLVAVGVVALGLWLRVRRGPGAGPSPSGEVPTARMIQCSSRSYRYLTMLMFVAL